MAAIHAAERRIREEKLMNMRLADLAATYFPRLETKYHWRWSVSRPSSEWDRVQPLRHNHQVGKEHVHEKLVFVSRTILIGTG